MHSKKVGLFDLDSSLADFETALRDGLELLRSPDEPVITNLWEAEKQLHIRNRMRLIKSQPDWWINLQPILSGLYIYRLAARIGFDNQVCTCGPKRHSVAWGEKVEWCHRHLDPSQEMVIHVTRDKSAIYGHFLFDDFPEYLEGWLEVRPRGIGIMLVNESNKNYSHPRLVKYDPNKLVYNHTNLGQVEDVLKKIYLRQSNELIDVGEPHLIFTNTYVSHER